MLSLPFPPSLPSKNLTHLLSYWSLSLLQFSATPFSLSIHRHTHVHKESCSEDLSALFRPSLIKWVFLQRWSWMEVDLNPQLHTKSTTRYICLFIQSLDVLVNLMFLLKLLFELWPPFVSWNCFLCCWVVKILFINSQSDSQESHNKKEMKRKFLSSPLLVWFPWSHRKINE